LNATASALDDLAAVLFKWAEKQTVIKPTLHRRNNNWYRLQIVEIDEDNQKNQWYNQGLNDRVEWTAEKLKDWPNVKRMSFDMWDFKHRKDAEKFITVFHLSWQQ
jgi:hypothetical protein